MAPSVMGGLSLPVATASRVAFGDVTTDHAGLPERPDEATDPGSGAVRVLVQRLDPDVPLPNYALDGDAGADIVTNADVDLAPGQRAVVPTGIAIALPAGYAAFVHPRSGLAARVGLGLVNAPGTIDAGYRGEIKDIVINHDSASRLRLSRGERIAQLVVQRVERAAFVAASELPESVRGARGHGSTGGAEALAGVGPVMSVREDD